MTVRGGFMVTRTNITLSTMIAALVLVCSLAVAASAEAAALKITPGSFTTTLSTHQAGAHPDLFTSFTVDTDSESKPIGGSERDVVDSLPPGLVGAANSTPTCPMHVVVTFGLACPPDTAVGEAVALVTFPGNSFVLHYKTRIFNVVPYPGEPAAFGLAPLYPVRIDTKVRSDGDYGITTTSSGLTEAGSINGAELTFWGVPAEHNGPGPLFDTHTESSFGGPGGGERRAFLTNPTECSGSALSAALAVDSWLTPGVFDEATYDMGQITGCDLLAFEPSIDVQPESHAAGVPSGLAVDLSVPQNSDPDGLAPAEVRDVSVALPAGVTLSPSVADGLGACSDEQIGLHQLGAASCPDSSKIGTVELKTPLLDGPLTGEVFLGTQKSQDPQSGEMYRLFLQLAGSGVRVKLAGAVKVDPLTGQITATFASNPRLPFSDLKLRLSGGSRAPLVTPASCGTYTTHAEITPWSTDVPSQSNPSFTIDSNCEQASMFTPSMEAGVASPVAGSFSPLSVTLSRPDGQQAVSSLDVSLPPGLLGDIASVPLCPEAQAAVGSCSSVSQIGHVAVSAGAGADPLWIPQTGKAPTAVYLAGPYKGAPFSLSIVVPAQAGPFDLGTVVVRAALFVDRNDAHVNVKSDPIPTIVGGVPLNLQKISVTVDRPGFMLAPSSCSPMQVTGAASSPAGAIAALASRFQVGDCAHLKFAPKFTSSTSGSTKSGTARALGAALRVKLSYPSAPLGSQANIAKVKVSLPRQLPSRLVTLQKACLAAQFDKDPAGCPAASVVGKAKVITPLLSTPLTGPAYFVSHGGEAFPSLIMVLQGSGVTVQLVGKTFISHAGITSTSFESVPDVPFSTFELELPQGKYSALGVNGSLCAQRLIMPTDYSAQDGVTLHQNNTITAAGCARPKKAKAKKADMHKTDTSHRARRNQAHKP